MLTTEALRYCNNRIQELANKTYYTNEQVQTLRNIIASLFSYVDKAQFNDINLEIYEDWNDQDSYIYIEINNYNRHLFLDTNTEYVIEQDYIQIKPNTGSFDLHNINKLFDWVFKDEVH